jgi:DNA mismatch endonuclease (patch repair protein)
MEKALKSTLPSGRFSKVEAARSRIMRAIPSRGARSTERAFSMALARGGIGGWRIHPAGLPAKPDFYFPDAKLAIFVDGCFWHGCPRCGHVPARNHPFWSLKLALNKVRDRRDNSRLRQAGIKVIRIWEHELSSSGRQARLRRILKVLRMPPQPDRAAG